MSTARDSFGPRLRAARERANVTLEEISDTTKISRTLLAALENNDVTQWPKGIFRRAFLREYLAAIGVPSEAMVAEFVRLFPDEGGALALDTPGDGEMRLTLADDGPSWREMAARAAGALMDLGCVACLAAIATVRLDTPGAVAVAAVAYFTIATMSMGTTPGARWATLPRRRPVWRPASDMAPAREALHIVARGEGAAPVRAAALPEIVAEDTPQRLRAVSR